MIISERYGPESSRSPKTDGEVRYLLRLGNGQSWEIVATGDAGPWAGKLATIMRLKPCKPNGNPKLLFVREERLMDLRQWIPSRDGEGVLRDLPSDGWKSYELPSLRFWVHPGLPGVVCEMAGDRSHELEILQMGQALCPIYFRAMQEGGLPIHAALIEREGRGFLISAPGGTGKSTCCRRIPGPWRALSDDLSLVVVDEKGNYRAHPFPTWSDYMWRRSEQIWDVQCSLPLEAIFFLEQGTKDEMAPIGKGEAAASVIEAASQICLSFWRDLAPGERRTSKTMIFDNACGLARSIPAFRLRASIDGRFWEEMEAAVR
ncbi:MAG TPA: SynChlorMet cassette protein ScmC [Syntrophales bacterium]|nr:SynChlorMet cassette protein ScmC [Syntrophales bacterium]